MNNRAARSPWRLAAREAHFGALMLVALVTLAPLAWMLATSLKTPDEVFTAEAQLLPRGWAFDNYRAALAAAPFGRFFLNSLVVALTETLGILLTSALAGYAFARLEFPGRDTIFLLCLATMMVPSQVTMVPTYLIMQAFGWLDTYYALIVPRLVAIYGTFLLRQFFQSIPRELDEAARVDGAGRPRVLWQIILPTATPSLATLAIFAFTGSWNEFFWPLIVTNRTEMRTLQLGLAYFKNEYYVQWPLLMAATVMVSLPILVVFLALQRSFTTGVVLTGLKG
jgi:ABC-type glycerol-3-phosphate transport system permease component